jgi:outer membrane immunogenic protein
MRRSVTLALLCAALSCATGASAADMPVRMPVKAVPVAAAPAFHWTGFYLGAHVGAAFGATKWSNGMLPNDPSFIINQTAHYDRLIGGAQAGYNFQIQQWVIGVEADISKLKVNHVTITDAGNPPINEFLITKLSWIASLRGRLGISFDRWLAYVSGGAAFSNIRLSFSNPAQFNEVTVRSGWVVGAGAEYAFSENWIARVEYLYYDFGRHFVINFGLGTDPEYGRPTFHVARVGLSYKFGASPVVARY